MVTQVDPPNLQGDILPSYVGIVISHDIRIPKKNRSGWPMECHSRHFFSRCPHSSFLKFLERAFWVGILFVDSTFFASLIFADLSPKDTFSEPKPPPDGTKLDRNIGESRVWT